MIIGTEFLVYGAKHLASNEQPAPVGTHLNHISTTNLPLMSEDELLQHNQSLHPSRETPAVNQDQDFSRL